ncbi:hypothetical protein FA15DRAFT_652677 [Coprinopsis marcescibilis]|uniref:Uncharacterized protein n=1 Tax=Coprinopsis marcescibilis TaxID=230819 RepID=A0A5C3LJB0_COPMA|nr:hypothetical protein FA15DRAFT_652677 [Coprinopsis marcescibilis]
MSAEVVTMADPQPPDEAKKSTYPTNIRTHSVLQCDPTQFIPTSYYPCRSHIRTRLFFTDSHDHHSCLSRTGSIQLTAIDLSIEEQTNGFVEGLGDGIWIWRSLHPRYYPSDRDPVPHITARILGLPWLLDICHDEESREYGGAVAITIAGTKVRFDWMSPRNAYSRTKSGRGRSHRLNVLSEYLEEVTVQVEDDVKDENEV